MSSENSVNEYDVLVIGGGAAGVGVSIALMHAGNAFVSMMMVARDQVVSQMDDCCNAD